MLTLYSHGFVRKHFCTSQQSWGLQKGQLIGNNPPSSAGIAEVFYSDDVYPRSERCMSSVAAQSLVCLLCLSDHGVCVVFCVHLQVDLGGGEKKAVKRHNEHLQTFLHNVSE